MSPEIRRLSRNARVRAEQLEKDRLAAAARRETVRRACQCQTAEEAALDLLELTSGAGVVASLLVRGVRGSRDTLTAAEIAYHGGARTFSER